jgi:hypothetical protein
MRSRRPDFDEDAPTVEGVAFEIPSPVPMTDADFAGLSRLQPTLRPAPGE